MPDISTELNNIKNARYGKDVRQSIYDGIKKVNDNLEDAGVNELLDIRVGADGKTYPSAGDAVREQVSSLKEDLSKFDISANYKATLDGYLSPTGDFVSDSYWKSTEFIPVCGEYGDIYFVGTLVNIDDEFYNIWAYDKTQKPISGIVHYDTTTTGLNIKLELPAGTQFIRITTRPEYADDFRILYSASTITDLCDDLSNIDETVTEIGGTVTNLIEPTDVTGELIAGYVDATTGVTGTGGTYQRTNYIPVNKNLVVQYSGRVYDSAGVAGYDENKVFVAPILSLDNVGITYNNFKLNIPDNVKYIIATTNASNFPLKIVTYKKIPDTEFAIDDDSITLDKIDKNTGILPIYDHFSAFLNFTAIGDSLTWGLCPKTYNDDGSVATWGGSNECSWVRHLATLTGSSAVNLGVSGASAKTWWNNTNGYPKMISGKRTQAYIIGLGINDIISDDYPLGSTADIDFNDYNNNAETFIGCYAKIVQGIMQFNPSAKIFVLGNPRIDYTDATNVNRYKYAALIEMCELENFVGTVFFVDLYKDWNDFYLADSIERWRRGAHYSAPAYHQMARIMLSALSKRMTEDYKEFEVIYDIPYDN